MRFLPPPVAAFAGGLVEAAFRLRGKQPPVCREMVRTLLHGHRYDGSRAARELGLRYTPVAETFRRTIDWAVGEGLVQRPAQTAADYPGLARVEEAPWTIQTIPPSPSRRTASRRGHEHKPDPPEENLDPDFARGQRHGEPGEEGRFSEGQRSCPTRPRSASSAASARASSAAPTAINATRRS